MHKNLFIYSFHFSRHSENFYFGIAISVIYSHNKYVYIHIYMFMQHHNDTIIKTDAGRTRRKTSLTIFISHFIARVRKGCVGFYCEREVETEQKLQYFDPTVMTVTLCLSCSLGLLNWRPRDHSAGCWLSLLHLISIFSGPQLIRASRPQGLMWLSLPHTVSNWLELSWQLHWPPGTGTQFNWLVELNWVI